MSKKIKVDLGKNSYNISLIEDFKASIVKFASSTESQCMLITQEEIFNLYKSSFNELSDLANVNVFLINQGEEAKSFESISSIVNDMASKHFDRSSLVFAVGGGVVGDVAGFAASIFMRGIKYIQYPTTLLAMVDSAIGGKTGINLQSGKNLVGRIYQPIAVKIDTNFLSTLPKREMNAALAEVVKYGFIYDKEFFEYLTTNIAEIDNKNMHVLQKIIIQCCEIKGDIVSEDENENELRMILNFGHTVGHGLESFKEYKDLLHGEAIFFGMKCALYLSNKFGKLSDKEYMTSIQFLSKFDLPNLDIDDKDKFINFVMNDKKFRDKKIRFILLDEIGKSRISEDISFDQIKESLSAL
tara:strand:+ start:660 stop:1727 length:1068 start_codon:yes stop_codon:yes gene_type:complete